MPAYGRVSLTRAVICLHCSIGRAVRAMAFFSPQRCVRVARLVPSYTVWRLAVHKF